MPPYDPPTEPFVPAAAPAFVEPARANAAPVAAPVVEPPPPAAHSPFSATHYRFTTGLRAGEVASIRDADDRVLLAYRSFASVSGVVAALVSGIVALAGLASVLFLIAEGAPFRAFLALLLTFAFASAIALLVPRVNVTLYDGQQPALTLSQRTIFPAATYAVTAPNGTMLAELRKSVFSRLGRNRWTVTHEGRFLGEAKEDSLAGAMARKFLGKFNRRFETNIQIAYGGIVAGHIVRKPDAANRVDLLELTNDTLDPRIAVALATLVLGSEP
ncbi:MAG TPA: hypothetical protein VF911_13670 [Thermoanaerobaculia bacterium]